VVVTRGSTQERKDIFVGCQPSAHYSMCSEEKYLYTTMSGILPLMFPLYRKIFLFRKFIPRFPYSVTLVLITAYIPFRVPWFGLLTERKSNTLPVLVPRLVIFIRKCLALVLSSKSGHENVRLHVLSRVGLKVTGNAGVPIWVVATNCVESRILRVTGTAGVPIWVTGDKSVEGRVCIWVTGNNMNRATTS